MKNQLKYLLFIDAFIIFATALFTPLYAIFVIEIGGGIAEASYAWAAFAITMGIFMFFISRWEDKIKHQEKILIASYGLMAIGVLSLIFVKTPLQLIGVQCILGIAEAFNLPVFESMYTKALDKGKAASEWGAWNSLWAICTGIAALVGGFIASTFGFKTLFVTMFVMATIGFFLSLKLIKNIN